MSVVAAYIDPDGYGAIGSDSLTSAGGLSCLTGTKVVRLKDGWAGAVGRSSVGAALRRLEGATHVEDLPRKLRDVLTANGQLVSDDGAECMGGQVLVLKQGRPCRLVLIDGAFTAYTLTERAFAIGSGAPYALAAMCVMAAYGDEPPPDEVVSVGLEMALAMDPDCGGERHIQAIGLAP